MTFTTTTKDDASGGTDDHRSPRGLLCAYSPRWLSGPTPAYRGLCPTWSPDEATGEHERVSIS